MSTHTAFWPETRRAIAQWAGIVLASVLSGSLLSILLRQGMNERLALRVALSVGFLMAVLFWLLISRRFAGTAVEYTVGVSTNVISLERADGTQEQSLALAAAVIICISLYPSQPPTSQGGVPIMVSVHHAIPKL
jgi:hypothetical protein